MPMDRLVDLKKDALIAYSNVWTIFKLSICTSMDELWEYYARWDVSHRKINTAWCEVAQSCPTLCDPMDYSLPGSSIHGILQARILESVAISSSRGSSWPRDWTHVSYVSWISRQILYCRATAESCTRMASYKHLQNTHNNRSSMRIQA